MNERPLAAQTEGLIGFPSSTAMQWGNVLVLAVVLLTSLTLVALPLAETLIEAGEIGDSHTSAALHEHGNDSCPDSTHSDAPCPCLCCPGHMVALEPLSFFDFPAANQICSIGPVQPAEKALPLGIRVDVYKPPQWRSFA